MVAMALWHLELTPGLTENILVRRDFQITNVALGEEIADVNSRSVIKVTHSPINPMLLESDDEDDSEFDDEDDEDEDDEEEEEEDDEEVEEPKAKKGGKVSVLEGKTAAELDEEDEDMDDLSEGSDFSLDEPEATAVIASLTPGKIEQATTNLIFVQGEAVSFEVSGKNVVHLMGNYILQETGSHHDHGHDDYDDLDSDDEDYDEELDSDNEMDSVTSSQIEDMERMFGLGDKKSRVELLEDEPKKTPASNKRKAENQEVDSPVSAAKAAISSAATTAAKAVSSAASALTGAAGEAAKEGKQLSKAEKKKLAKKMKLDSGEAAEGVKETVEATKEKVKEVVEKVATPKKEEKKAAAKQTLPSGLIIEDTKVGEGQVAKQGKRLGMRYIGKLTSGKQFDANTSGSPFKFVLGRGEVIKGWDQGIAGMKVGGERRLTIPAALAYGKQKIPGIPPNSTLIFEIKLVDVK